MIQTETSAPRPIALTLAHLCNVLSAWTGIPASRIAPGKHDVADLEPIRKRLAGALFGQDAAIDAAVSALRCRYGLPHDASAHRPVWTMLAAGPSGVGKTKLAEEIARALWDDDNALLRIDCSSLDQEHHLARLTGSPPGYVGHGQGGELTDMVRRRTDGILLFDEVEKAHPRILTKVILPLLGEGVVHDMNDGRSLDVSNMIVIMTTNLGFSTSNPHPAGFNLASTHDSDAGICAAIQEHFPAEVLGRVDDVIVFQQLPDIAVHQIWSRETAHLQQRLSVRHLIHVEMGPGTEEMLLSTVRPELEHQGARAVVRLFEKSITDRCVQLLGSGAGPGTVVIKADTDGLRFLFKPEQS